MYNRVGALLYAQLYAFNVCHDGRVATSGIYPRAPAGSPINQAGLPEAARRLPNAYAVPHPVLNEDDCTHFISCCIGANLQVPSPPAVPNVRCGGGLSISQPFGSSVFGHTTVPNLLWELLGITPLRKPLARIAGSQFQKTNDETTRSNIARLLQPGDLLAYSEKTDPSGYIHFAIIVGDANIACHTYSRYNIDYTDVKKEYVTLVNMLDT